MDEGNERPTQTAEAGRPLSVVPVSREELAERIRGTGARVVLVDFWATWCQPCKQQFSHTVQLAEKYANSDVVVMSVSLDPQKNLPDVVEFLSSEHADGLRNYIADYDLTAAFAAFDIEQGIPEYRLYDAAGQLRYTFRLNGEEETSGAEGEQQVEAIEYLEIRLRELLEASPRPH